MEFDSFLDPEEIELGGTKFTISRIPAFQAQQIYGDVIRSADGVGDIGMTFLPEPVSRLLLKYTAFCDGDTWFVLDQEQRMDRAFKTLHTLLRLEVAMIRKNFGFLFDGGLQSLLEDLRGVAGAEG